MNNTAVPTPVFEHNEDESKRFVLFDMFNTLVRLSDNIADYETLDVLYRMYLSEYDYKEVKRLYDEKVYQLIKERRSDNLEIVFAEILEYMFSELGFEYDSIPDIENKVFHGSDYVSQMEGAKETLKFFKDNGYRIGVLSNSFFLKTTLETCLRKMDVFEPIDILVSSADILYMKPRKEAYDIALKELGADPKYTFFIGDDPVNDYDGPLSQGMHPIHIHLKGETRDVNVKNVGQIPYLFK